MSTGYTQIEGSQAGKLAQFRGQRVCQSVAAQIQILQRDQVPHLRREGSGQQLSLHREKMVMSHNQRMGRIRLGTAPVWMWRGSDG